MILSRSQFLALSSFFLLIWFRFESFFHSFWLLNGAIALLSALLFIPLFKSVHWRSLHVIASLWLLITSILFADFIHFSFLCKYSEAGFRKEVDQVTAIVHQRATRQVDMLRDNTKEVREELNAIDVLSPGSIFVRLQDRLGKKDYSWAVYDDEGALLAWNGEFSTREIRILPESEEISVYNALHQQFWRLKQVAILKNLTFIIVVNKPIAADYGIQTRYLRTYNLLTDGLSIRPDLLYNSQVTISRSSDLVIKNFTVTPDFSISVLLKKTQYQEFLTHQNFRLHWWFELTALLYLLFGIIYSFFEFIGISGQHVSSRSLWGNWLVIVLIAAFGLVLVSEFSAFGSNWLFKNSSLSGKWRAQISSSGGLFITSFLALNVVWSFAVLLWKTKPSFAWRYSWLNYGWLFAVSLIAGWLIKGYLGFVKSTLVLGPFDPVEGPLFQENLIHVIQILGNLWLDLSFLILIGILSAIGLAPLLRTRRDFVSFLTLQIVVAVLFLVSLPSVTSIPVITSLILFFGTGLFVFFLPRLGNRFERINLFSRFLIALLLFSIVSFIFHFTRFHFAGNLRKDFIEQSAKQVRDQDKVIQRILASSRKQLDEALLRLSIDPKIPDLAFRLWTRTDLARFGARSSLEIYDEEGRLVNRFSVNLPRLAIPILDTVLEGGWGTERRFVLLGNVRKPVHFAVRDITGVGYLVIEAAQDYESLSFMAPTNPFQELFRFHTDAYTAVTPDLNVYDFQWRPVFVSRADLSLSTQQGQDLLRQKNSGWVQEKWGGRTYDVYFFDVTTGYAALILPAVAAYVHLVHVIDLLLINLIWLSVFSLIFVTFFRHYLILHFQAQAVAGFNFFQKLMIAFVVFSMVPIVSFSLVMRNYAWEKEIEEVTSRALNSFSVATKVVGDYLFYRAEEQDVSREQLFSNELLEWISQVTQQDVTFYYNRHLLASSNRELYAAGLLPEQMPGQTYVDLFLKGQKYSISEARIGEFRFLNVSGRIYTGRYRDEVITIPFLIEERSLQEEIAELREYMMLVGAGLVLLAVLLGYSLANRFSQPVEVLIHGTGEMSRGNLTYRIQERYRDEFRQLVNSFNAMAASLDEQQTALERRRAYIENILNNITTAVVSVDSIINVATYNPAAVSLFRMPTPYSGPLENLVPDGPEWQSVATALRAFIANREHFGLKEVALRSGQQESYLRMVYVPLFTEGNWSGSILLVEDITEIIRSNRLSAWAEMARRVAHEVKNPLTPIQLSIEHLVRVYHDRSENFSDVLRECSDAILKQVKTLRRLVSDFSLYGRPAVLNKTDVDLEPFLKELISHYRFPEGIGVHTNIDEDLPTVRIDPDKIRGALMNIIENGLQAMNGNGKIVLKAERTPDSSVRIQIQDTGQGVPPDILPRLFEPYFSTKTGGTGLGLAIARKNIEDHGGKIQVESKEGKGTTVTITLPI
ncbi:ATP-binding protein [bacterium]|nr:ATP-binding protein [bacterium]MCI0603854.1 ATP-binding protein [bacterium]